MVDRPGITAPEIAAKYDRSIHTVNKIWRLAPDWPKPIGRRGQHLTYDPDAVDAWVAARRETPKLDPDRLYTARELEAAGIGISATTIRSELSRRRWPQPDEFGAANRWYGRTVTAALAKRRGYRRQA